MTTQLRPDGLQWTLREARNGRPVARGGRSCPHLVTCLAASRALLDVSPHAACAAPEPGGGLRRRMAALDGTVVAESAEEFGHPAACGYALHEVHALAQDRPDRCRGHAPPARR